MNTIKSPLFDLNTSIVAQDGSWKEAVSSKGEFDSAFEKKDVSKKKPTTQYKRCYETHPVLELGGGKFIGGSCSDPVTDDADVYIGFDSHIRIVPYKPGMKPATYINFPITDMQAPSNFKNFEDLICLCVGYLAMGKTIHAGCIGGHGRTGTFLAALVKAVNGTEDAITWVRKHYCEKAVESNSQVEFLHKYFGITKVAGHKVHSATGGHGKYSGHYQGGTDKSLWPSTGSKELKPSVKHANASRIYYPVRSPKSITESKIL